MKCKFTAGAIAVFWSFGETTIPVGYPGHEINNDMIDSGESYLRVNRSLDLKDSYRCIAIFQDAPSQEQTIADFPEPASMHPHNGHMHKHFLCTMPYFVLYCVHKNPEYNSQGHVDFGS